MKLHIHSSNISDREELRTLMLDAIDDLLGEGHRILEPKLPWDGHPVLAADAAGQPVLISFEPENSQAALISGLAGIEQLAAALPWINQIYDALQHRQLPPRLIVVSREAPPGAASVLAGCPNLTLYTYKILRINGDTGLWLERLHGGDETGVSAFPTETTTATPLPQIDTGATAATEPANLPDLSEEENTYFQQL